MRYDLFLSLVLVFAMTLPAAAIEEPKYQVVHKYSDFEIRDYASYLVAETTVQADFERAGDEGFRRLFDYISGHNSARQSITMTAPVIQVRRKIEMASPVIQGGEPGAFTVQFVMPPGFTLQTLPVPSDGRVRLREIPAAHYAVIRYSGFWTRNNYESHLQTLLAGIKREHLTVAGAPLWARYDPPFMPWFFRRNEIFVPVKQK